MVSNPRSLSIPGGGFFLAGILLGLFLSSGILWGEVEAYTRETGSNGPRLGLDCPLMLSPDESGQVSTRITNTTGESVKPVITAEINGKPGLDQTLSLAPGEARSLDWTVDSSARIFDRMILVNMYQGRYRDLEPRQGSCGILVYSLFGMSGTGTFRLIFGASVLLMILGGFLWLSARSPLKAADAKLTYASGFLGSLVLASLLSSLPRWWGLILLLNALILLMIGIIITEFIIHPGNDK
jgi:hypothetical protein